MLLEEEFKSWGHESHLKCDMCGKTPARLSKNSWYPSCIDHFKVPPTQRRPISNTPKPIELIKDGSRPKKKVNHKRNRSAGRTLEYEIRDKLIEIGFPFACRAGGESTNRDNLKVDIMNLDEDRNGRLPLNIQCKSLINKADYHKILAEMPKDGIPNVIIHQFTKENPQTGQFREIGQYAIMEDKVFWRLIKLLKDNGISF